MNKAAEVVYSAVSQEGTQQSVVGLMQTRKELYDSINYWDYENRLNALFKQQA